jgi:hypothetical protein
MFGCEEGGKILLTIYPGYLVGDRVFEKALVFTVPEEEAESVDEKSHIGPRSSMMISDRGLPGH